MTYKDWYITYKGWYIFEDLRAPVTGRWRARRYGVGMCASTREALGRMIDARDNTYTPSRRQP